MNLLSRVPPLALLLLAGLGLRLLIAYVLFPGQGLGSDLRLFASWAETLTTHGPGGFYSHTVFVDYPPGYLYVLLGIGWISDLVGPASTSAIMAMLKLPAIGADLAIAALLYVEASAWRDKRAGLLAAGLFLFIPVTWYNSALWGQVDSFSALLMLGSLLLLVRGWSEPSVVLAVAATVTKPQSAIVLGLVAIVLLRRHLLRRGSGPVPKVGGRLAALDRGLRGYFTEQQGVWRLVSSVLVGVIAGVLILAPFDLPARAPNNLAGIFLVGHLAGLMSVIGSAAAFYSVLTANAFNPWALVGPEPLSTVLSGDYHWTFDSLPILGVPAVMVGIVLFVLVTAGVVAFMLRHDDRRSLAIALTVLAVAFFVLPTRVHERYLFPAFAVGALMAGVSVRWRWWFIALGIANFVNLHAILTLPYPGYGTPGLQALPLGDTFRQPWAVALASLAHLVLLAVAIVWLVRSRVPAVAAAANAEPTVEAQPPPSPPKEGGRGIRRRLASLLTFLGAAVEPIRRRLQAPPISEDKSAELAHEGRGRFDRKDLAVAALLLVAVLGLRAWRLDTPPTVYFDETFHARSAMEFLQNWRYGIPHDISEDTHPHLAKYLIAAGIAGLGNGQAQGTVSLAPATDVAAQAVFRRSPPATEPGGDVIAIASGDGIRLARHGDLEGSTFVSLPGASAVAFDPAADRLFAATADGLLWVIDRPANATPQTAPTGVGRLGSGAESIWAIGTNRLLAADAAGNLSLVDVAAGTTLATAAVPGLAGLVAITVQERTMLLAATTEGIVELDVATLASILRVDLPAPSVSMALLEGSDRASRDRSLLTVPTLFVATEGSRIENVQVFGPQDLRLGGGLTMPGPVTELAWDKTNNMIYAAGVSPRGGPTMYVVDPVLRTVFADEALPFAPAHLLLDVQPGEPGLDRQRALAFGPNGTVAVSSLGNLAFSWRLPGVLAASLMALLMYVLARILFRRRTVAVLLGVFISLDGLLFSHSRIAMNDAFVGLFVVAGLALLAYLLTRAESARWTTAVAAIGLPTIGVLLGLGLATKWVAAYAIGAAVLLILMRTAPGRWVALAGFVVLTAVLGWLAVGGQSPNFTFLALMVTLTLIAAAAVARSRREPASASVPAWADPRRTFGAPFIYAMACLVVIPLGVYVISFVPWAQVTGADAQGFIDQQVQMYRFHDELRTTHGASSPWWAWPVGLKPIWGYYDTFVDGTQAMVFSLANPVLLWMTVPAVAFGAWQAWRRRSVALAFVLIAFLALWLPWARIDRFTLNYHYYLALPFALLLLAYLLAELWNGPSRRTWLLARVAFAIVLIAPVALWLLKDPLCAVAGVGQVNADSFVCGMSLAQIGPWIMAWWIGALVAAWLVISVRRPQTLVIAFVAVAAVVAVVSYPVLSAWRLPNGWPLVVQSLLPTWEGTFQFASNTAPYAAVPLLSPGPLLIGLVTTGLVWWVMGRRWPGLAARREGPREAAPPTVRMSERVEAIEPASTGEPAPTLVPALPPESEVPAPETPAVPSTVRRRRPRKHQRRSGSAK